MEFNSCADLLNDEKISRAKEKFNLDTDTFGTMLGMQAELQRELCKNAKGMDFENLKNLGEVFDYIRDAKDALNDEFREVVDALPGMNSYSEKERSGLWKKWKKNHEELRARKLSDLSEDEIRELKFEVCDMFHFFMNIMLALGMSSEEMYTFYMYKNAENFDRIKRQY
jgi:hypothetical protein